MRKILVTGGSGFIGSALVERLIADKENQVVVIDDLSTGHIKKLPFAEHNNLQFIKSDTNNYQDVSEVMLSFKFDYVFHYAALVGVQRTLQNPIKVLDDIDGIKNILNISKNAGVKRIFFSSSSEIYGEPVELPQNVYTTPLNSRLPYAIVKNIGEAFLRSFYQEYGLHYTIFRFFNTYGSKQSKDFVISKFIEKALKNQNITIYGDGSQTRTFCYIDDNIETCVKTLYENTMIDDVMNVGGDIEITILELANKIIELTRSKSKIVYSPALKEGDMSRRLPDISAMRKILKREPISLDEGLNKVLKQGLFEMNN